MNINCNIARCPICNKVPEVVIGRDEFSMGYTGTVVVQCKPFMRKAHLSLRCDKTDMNTAVKKAINGWNYIAIKQKEDPNSSKRISEWIYT